MTEAKVLIIEDNPFMAQLLVSRLKANNYDGLVALSGIEGLDKAQKEKPDVILLDINMPDMDGFEAAKQLKANPQTKSIPLIFVTARGDEKDISKGLKELGSEAYIVKPFKPEVLLDEIKKTLDKKKFEDYFKTT